MTRHVMIFEIRWLTAVDEFTGTGGLSRRPLVFPIARLTFQDCDASDTLRIAETRRIR